jgi:hypothetical protein
MASRENTHPTVRTFPELRLLPRSLQLDWSYAGADTRDLRLDLLRGFAVFVMVVDHFGGASWLYYVTGNNSFFVSGAEAFVFISGLVVGMVYGGIALKQGLRAAQTKALERAWTLYKLTVALTLLFGTFSFLSGMPWAKELQIENPLMFVIDVVMLRQTFYLSDVMLMYAFLMACAAGALWLLVNQRTGWLLAVSGAAWLAFQLFRIELPWQIAGNATFNFAAWQLLFFVAMAMGYHRKELTEKLNGVPRGPYLALSAILLLLLVQFYTTHGELLSRWIPAGETDALMQALFLKSALGPGRLVACFILFQFAYLAATLFWKPTWAALGWLLAPLGQNALYAYTMHVGIVGLARAALIYLPGNLAMVGTINTSLQLLAVFSIWVMIQRQFLFKIVPR